MTRAQIWQLLDPSQQAQVAAWLRQVDGLKTPDNVWLLFPVTVDVVLRALGVADAADPAANPNYQKIQAELSGQRLVLRSTQRRGLLQHLGHEL